PDESAPRGAENGAPLQSAKTPTQGAGEQHRVEGRGDGGAERQSALGQQLHQNDVGSQVDGDHQQRDTKRCDDVLQRIEHPDQQGGRGLPRQPQAEEGQGVGGLPDRVLPELAPLEERGGDRHAQDRDADGRGNENKNIEPQRQRGAMPDGVDGAERQPVRQSDGSWTPTWRIAPTTTPTASAVTP